MILYSKTVFKRAFLRFLVYKKNLSQKYILYTRKLFNTNFWLQNIFCEFTQKIPFHKTRIFNLRFFHSTFNLFYHSKSESKIYICMFFNLSLRDTLLLVLLYCFVRNGENRSFEDKLWNCVILFLSNKNWYTICPLLKDLR